jgi:hypothetical protein
MANNSIRSYLRRRRTQRWLQREARLLATEADRFGCPEMRREARKLMQITDTVGNLVILRPA